MTDELTGLHNRRAFMSSLDKELSRSKRNKEDLSILMVDIDKFKLIGFGAGIDSGKHYKEMIDFIANIEKNEVKDAFIFSTSAIYSEDKMYKDHSKLRNILRDNGYRIKGEFSCKGYNTNSFLKYIGGMNKGRPNNEDIKMAKEFAKQLL